MPSLLAEDILLPVDVGIKDRVQVDMHQVLEVRFIAAGHGIHSLVGIGHRVEEGVERSLYKFNKGILYREVPRSAQNCVLNNMRDTGGILRRSPECDIEDFVVVRGRDQGDPCAGFFVPEQHAVASRVFEKFMPQKFVFVKNLTTDFHCHLIAVTVNVTQLPVNNTHISTYKPG